MYPGCTAIAFFMIAIASLCAAQSDSLRIYYAIAETVLLPAHQRQIDSFLRTGDDHGEFQYLVVSSADYLGSAGINRRISDARLAGVIAYLESVHNIPAGRITTRSLGEIPSGTDVVSPAGAYADRSVLLRRTRVTTDAIEALADAKAGDTLIIDNLNFQPGRHILLPESIPRLRRLLSILQDHPGLHIEIHGHICCLNEPGHTEGIDNDTGKRELSVNRAINIYNFLVHNGIDSTRLAYKAFGVTRRLIDPERTEEDQMRNRRVEIVITRR